MKRGVCVIMALFFLVGLLSISVFAQTADAAFSTPLIAGKNMEVGYVEVSNEVINEENILHVKYVISDDNWCLGETHLHVAESLADIPQTKKGNPKPGRFDYSDPHACVQEYTYSIPLDGWGQETELYVAAHAALGDLTEVETMTVKSNIGDTVYGPLYEDPFADGDPFSDDCDWGMEVYAAEAKNYIGIVPNPLTGDSSCGSYAFNWGNGQPTDIPDSLWISTAENTEEWWRDSWRWFTKSFDTPGFPVSGLLMVNSDNKYFAYFNRVEVDSDDRIFDPPVEVYPLTLMGGTNVLDFIVANFAQGSEGNSGDQCRNPNGLTYKAEIDYVYDSESAWADGTQFNVGKNWATYFTYEVQ